MNLSSFQLPDRSRFGPLPDRDQLSVLVGTLILGFTLVRFIDIPVSEIGMQAFGSAVGFQLSSGLTMLLVLAALAATGMDTLLRSHPKAQTTPQAGAFVLWGLPVLTVVALGIGINALPLDRPVDWWIGLTASAGILVLVFVAEYISFDTEHPFYTPVQVLQTGLIYLLALIFFSLIYSTKSRALLIATLSTFVAAALALRLLWIHARGQRKTFLYAGLCGLALGQCVWALGYGRVAPLAEGLLLLLLFYLSTGLSQAALQNTFTRRTVLEFGVVAAIGLVIVWRLMG